MDFLKAKTNINIDTNSEIKSVADVKEDKIEAIENDVVSDINEEFKNSETSVEEKKDNVVDDKGKTNVFNDL